MGKRNALAVQIQPDDIAWARRQDKYNCAIVRAIQRQLPEATHVSADAKTIRFTLRYGGDGSNDYRYIFETPKEVVAKVIEPFDSGQDIEPVSFILSQAIDAREPSHRSPEESAKHRREERDRHRINRSRNRIPRPLHQSNRFVIEPDDPRTELTDLRNSVREATA